jgi:hypothetical protein
VHHDRRGRSRTRAAAAEKFPCIFALPWENSLQVADKSLLGTREFRS